MKALFSWIPKLSAWFATMLSDGENPSSTRFMAVTVMFSCVFLPMAIWAKQAWAADKMPEIPGSLIGFMSAASTLFLALFHLNKRQETAADSDPNPQKSS